MRRRWEQKGRLRARGKEEGVGGICLPERSFHFNFWHLATHFTKVFHCLLLILLVIKYD